MGGVSDQCPDFLPLRYLLSVRGLRLIQRAAKTGMDFDRGPTVPRTYTGANSGGGFLFKSIVSEGRGLVTETIPQLLLSTAFLATTRLIPGAERRGIIRSMPNRVGVSQPAICSAEKVPERLVIAK